MTTQEKQHYYEGMFITRAGGGKQAWEHSKEAVEEILEKYDAEIDYTEEWADQNLAYSIDKEKRGKYLLTYFRANPENISEIRRDANIEERILRTLIVNREKEELYEKMIDARIEKKKEEEEEESEEEEEEEEEEISEEELDEETEEEASEEEETEAEEESEEEEEEEVDVSEEEDETEENEDQEEEGDDEESIETEEVEEEEEVVESR